MSFHRGIIFLNPITLLEVHVPLATHGRRLPGTIFSLLILSIHLALLYSIANSLRTIDLTLPEIKVASILALSGIGLLLLARSRQPATIKDILLDIRRELVLGDAPFTESLNKTRIALNGMAFSDIAQQDTRRLLEHIAAARREYEDAFQRIEELKKAQGHESSEVKELDDIAKLALGNTLDVLKGHESRVLDISKSYYDVLHSFYKRMSMFTRFSGVGQDDLYVLMKDIASAQEPVNEQLRRFTKEYLELQDTWNRRFPEEQRDYEPFKDGTTIDPSSVMKQD